LKELEGFERVSGEDENEEVGDVQKPVKKQKRKKTHFLWNEYPAVYNTQQAGTAVGKRSPGTGVAKEQPAGASSTRDEATDGSSSRRRGRNSVDEGSDPAWKRMQQIQAKGKQTTAAEKREFKECLEKFSSSVGMHVQVIPETDLSSKKTRRLSQDEESNVRESRFLTSFASGGIEEDYIIETVQISNSATFEVFQSRLPCLFGDTGEEDVNGILETGEYWNSQTVHEFTLEALSRVTWKHRTRDGFAVKYWVTTETLFALLELLGLCLPAELAVHLEGMHSRVHFSHQIFHEFYRVCSEDKDHLQELEATCFQGLTADRFEGGALMRSRLGNFRQTPFHWKLLRILRERVFQWAVMSENHTFFKLLKEDGSDFRHVLKTVMEHMKWGPIRRCGALFLEDDNLFPKLVAVSPIATDHLLFKGYCFWIRSSAARTSNMQNYAHSFFNFDFSDEETVGSGLVTPGLGSRTEEGLEELFYSVFLREYFEEYMDNETQEYEGGFHEYKQTLFELFAVSPPALRLLMGANSLGMIEYRPLFSSLFHLALHWNKIAPHDLKFPNFVIAENPHPDGAFETDSKMIWWRDVQLCDEMKPLALLGTLVDKTCSRDVKCARLQISAGKLEEVKTFVASFLPEDMGHSLRLYLEPKARGKSGAVSAFNQEVESTAQVLASFKSGSMFPYFSHAYLT